MATSKSFGEITSKIGSGATPRGGSNSYKTAGTPLIRSQNILDFQFSPDGLAFIDDKQAEKLSNVIVEQNDILLNITGDSVARCCIVPSDYVPGRVNQHVAIIRPLPDRADYKYVYYYLQSIKPKLLSLAEIGATRRALTKGMIEDLEIQLPPLPEQRAIASVLSSLDDKIHLLHRQNKTLEEMAEVLFRQWFVEEAKEEWEETTLFNSIKLIGGGTPKTTVEEYWNGNINWLSGGDISTNHKSVIIEADKKISSQGLNNSSAKLLPKFSTVISARGTVGKYCILSGPMAFSQSNYGVIPNVDNCYFFTYLLINHCVEMLQSAAYGSVFDTITTATFKSTEIVIPSDDEIIQFDKNVTPIFVKILNNQFQVQTLTSMRDVLLPKLMSGKVRVNANR